MKTFTSALALSLVLAGCGGEDVAPTETAAATPATAAPAQIAETTATTTTSAEPIADATQGVWGGQLRIDAHAGKGTLNYVGAESGDFVPMRFRTDSAVGAKILAACADEDLCEIEGQVRFLDEPPPDNASAVGEIVTVDRVRKLPDDAR